MAHPSGGWPILLPFSLNSQSRGCPILRRFLRRVGFHTVRLIQIQSRAAGRLIVARHGPEASLRAEGQVPGKQKKRFLPYAVGPRAAQRSAFIYL